MFSTHRPRTARTSSRALGCFFPELHWRLGYPGIIRVMAVICGVLYWRFKHAGWL